MTNDRQVVIRVPADTVSRARRVASALAGRPEYAGVRMAWTTVMRLALLRGLRALEAQAKPKRRRDGTR